MKPGDKVRAAMFFRAYIPGDQRTSITMKAGLPGVIKAARIVAGLSAWEVQFDSGERVLCFPPQLADERKKK